LPGHASPALQAGEKNCNRSEKETTE